MATFSVDFGEMHGYPKSRWVRGEFRATRRLICDWGDRVTLLNELNTNLGSRYPYREGPIYEVAPLWYSMAFAYAVEIDPFPAKETEDGTLSTETGQSTAQYDQAVLTVHYSSSGPNWSTNRGTFITERLEPYTKHGMAAKTHLKWTDDKPLERDLPWSWHSWEYVLTFHRLTGPPSGSLALIGTTNNNVVGSLIGNFAIGTLLYKPPTILRTAEWGGIEKWQATYRFPIHPYGWNKHWRPNTADFENVYKTSDGLQYLQYPLAAFP